MQAAWRDSPGEPGVKEEACRPNNGTTVAVVIPAFNQARFLADALNSVLAQTRPADEIIVVDDGSTDDPATVVAQFQQVRLIRQDGRGPSAARNIGFRNCTASYVVFLDADDRLLPTALETGLACITDRPDCAFVYGGFRLVSEDGHTIGPDRFDPIQGDAHLALLAGSPISVPSMVVFRRDCLLAAGGFDESLRRAEDRDLYLRVTEKHPIAGHPQIVAEYRRHGKNATNAYYEQLQAVLRLLDMHEARNPTDPVIRAALREGRASKRRHYASQMLAAAATRWHTDREIAVTELIQAARWSPLFTMRALSEALGRRASKMVPGAASGRKNRTDV